MSSKKDFSIPTEPNIHCTFTMNAVLTSESSAGINTHINEVEEALSEEIERAQGAECHTLLPQLP